jgi:hypothetical protein
MQHGKEQQGQQHSQILAQGNIDAFLLIFASLNIKVSSKSKVLSICECDGLVPLNRVTLKMEILSYLKVVKKEK